MVLLIFSKKILRYHSVSAMKGILFMGRALGRRNAQLPRRGARMGGYTGRRLRAAIRTYILSWHGSEAEKPSGNPKTDEERQRLRSLQRSGDIELGTGKLPEGFWDWPRPKDPEGSIREALIRERRESV